MDDCKMGHLSKFSEVSPLKQIYVKSVPGSFRKLKSLIFTHRNTINIFYRRRVDGSRSLLKPRRWIGSKTAGAGMRLDRKIAPLNVRNEPSDNEN